MILRLDIDIEPPVRACMRSGQWDGMVNLHAPAPLRLVDPRQHLEIAVLSIVVEFPVETLMPSEDQVLPVLVYTTQILNIGRVLFDWCGQDIDEYLRRIEFMRRPARSIILH